MKKFIAVLSITFFITGLKAQIYDPVSWSFSYLKTDTDLYEIIMTASIQKDSYIYALDVPENGPVPTSFMFDSTGSYTLIGKPYEITTPVEKFDEAFGIKIKTFSDTAEFRQKIKSEKTNFIVSGIVTFMSCSNSICLPPKDIKFSVEIGDTQKQEQTLLISDNTAPKKGLIKFFIGSFLLGLIGVLTPCVYPMIPMTVAFFARGTESQSKSTVNALIFGISIVLIYTSPGLIISLTGAGIDFTNTLSTHWIPNAIFFLLFVIFAVSLFGAFEITLPNKWVTSADSKVDRGGAFASFFLALTTVIISFSCTGPIVGSLLVEAAAGDVLRPVIGMFAFGLAFAIPFTIFAFSPGILKRLPKSGGWLNSVKIVLGFLMLAFSLKFIVNIDSVYNLNILSREAFIAIWIVIFSLLGLYLLGKIKLANDSEIHHIGFFRLFLAIVVFSFVVYMVPGLFGAPLKNLASFLPIQKSTSFNLTQITSQEFPENPAGWQPLNANCSRPKYANKFTMPYGLHGYFDYNQGIECAKEQGKPVLITFKGHACSNCKLMEAKVWSDPKVLERLRKFVIIALYTDDRTQLPENEWIISQFDGKIKKTIGRINENLEIIKFKTNAIPLHVITDYEGNPLNKPMSTTMNIELYTKWLDEGILMFTTLKK
ncbi:MAG: sulfite exporter TauE/SafE family protein [Bacteroidales bacterium]|nr:sulfite exporter TauE/SafE family protein [Bacteroidales bacterium]